MVKLLLEKKDNRIGFFPEGENAELVTMISDVMLQSEHFALIIETAFKNYLAHGGKETITDEDMLIAKKEVKDKKIMN